MQECCERCCRGGIFVAVVTKRDHGYRILLGVDGTNRMRGSRRQRVSQPKVSTWESVEQAFLACRLSSYDVDAIYQFQISVGQVSFIYKKC